MIGMTPKPFRAQSAALRNSARGRACTLRLPGCDGGGETTVLAHIRGTWTGLGTKPSDSFAVYACGMCHQWEELGTRGVCSDGDRLRALYETQQIMLREGLLTMAGRR